jgi:hypothetical protein
VCLRIIVSTYFNLILIYYLDTILIRTKHATVFIENGTTTQGSCCDDGRYYKKEGSKVCQNYWYYCPNMHEYTMAEWFKFGRFGLTMPLTTEHLGKCRYFPEKRLCDLPMNCKNRIPVSQGDACGEIPRSLGF